MWSDVRFVEVIRSSLHVHAPDDTVPMGSGDDGSVPGGAGAFSRKPLFFETPYSTFELRVSKTDGFFNFFGAGTVPVGSGDDGSLRMCVSLR